MNKDCGMVTMEMPWLDKKMMELWLKTPVKEIEAEDSSMKKENYLSKIKEVKVRTENGGIYWMMVKCRLNIGATADMFRRTAIFTKEREMYGNILKKLSQILQEVNPDDLEELAPKCYYACEEFLVLEDLRQTGFTMIDRRVGFELDQCLLVMRTLAKFHAASVMLHQENPSIYDKLQPPFFSEPDVQLPFKNFFSGLTNTVAEELETWGEEWHTYVVKLRHLADDLFDKTREVCMRRESDFNVLIHGDFWTNNILTKNRSDGIRFVDFQVVNFSSFAIDLHSFIASSTTLEVRIKHMNQLVQEYHKTLCYTLTALGYKRKLATLEELQQELDKKAVYGLSILLALYAVVQIGPDIEFSLDELFTSGRTPGPSMFGDTYKQAVKYLLPYYDSKGVLGE